MKYTMIHADKKLSFIPVRAWNMATNSAEPKITFSAPDFSGAISLELVSTNLNLTNSLQGVVTPMFKFYAGQFQGEAVDYEKALTPHTKLAGRRALLKMDDTAILLQMTCKPDVSENLRRQFHAFASSLHLETNSPPR